MFSWMPVQLSKQRQSLLGSSAAVCFLFQHNRLGTALTNTSLLEYLPGTNRLNIYFICQNKEQGQDPVTGFHAGLCSGQREVKQPSPNPRFLLKILFWKHKSKNFLLCYINKFAVSLVMFRNGSSNQPSVIWFVKTRSVYEITWNYGKTQVASTLEEGLQTWKFMGPELPLSWKYQLAQVVCTWTSLGKHKYRLQCRFMVSAVPNPPFICSWNSSDPGSQLNKLFCTQIILQRTRDVLCICNTWRTVSWLYFGKTQRNYIETI